MLYVQIFFSCVILAAYNIFHIQNFNVLHRQHSPSSLLKLLSGLHQPSLLPWRKSVLQIGLGQAGYFLFNAPLLSGGPEPRRRRRGSSTFLTLLKNLPQEFDVAKVHCLHCPWIISHISDSTLHPPTTDSLQMEMMNFANYLFESYLTSP